MNVSEQSPLVLVVDDDELHAQAVAHQLQLAGYRTELALDAVTALARIDGARPQLILLDINMPGVDGIELCRYLKSTLSDLEIPTLMITGLPGAATRRKASEAGADAYLVKPVAADVLLEAVERSLALQPV